MFDYDDDCKDYPDLADVAYSHGYVFGKHTTQIMLDDKFLTFLSNNPTALKLYHENYCIGFKAGFADNGLFVSSCF